MEALLSKPARNKMAAIFGLGLGVFYMISATVSYLQASHFFPFYAAKTIGYILYFVLMGLCAARIRKANGGYISFKDMYSAVIIMILISSTIYFIYNFIYIEYIDTQFVYKLKSAMITWMEQMKTPDEAINSTAEKFDKQIAESQKFNLGNNVLGYFSNILVDCLVGLLVAVINRKTPPLVEQSF